MTYSAPPNLSQPENRFYQFYCDNKRVVVPSFTLESGVTLANVPVAYRTYGKLGTSGDNAILVCHAFTGSANVHDWWPALLGPKNKALDTSRLFVVCINCLGSPYGTASPVTYIDGDSSKGIYGPRFPLTTVRDDAVLFKLVLDGLGVTQLAAVIGGSLGGMIALEFAYFGQDYVRTIVAIATSARQTAWGISWGEMQRQCIYTDPNYCGGHYSLDAPPLMGLSAARMAALMTYRSSHSFEARFDRRALDQEVGKRNPQGIPCHHSSGDDRAIHNEGNQFIYTSSTKRPDRTATAGKTNPNKEAQINNSPLSSAGSDQPYFSAQSYLRYQSRKFVHRFDANCFISITRKLDTHDVSRGRVSSTGSAEETVKAALGIITQPSMIIGVVSDGLFNPREQDLLAAGIPNSSLRILDTPEGHDAFLLKFEEMNQIIIGFLSTHLPALYSSDPESPSWTREQMCPVRASVAEDMDGPVSEG